MHHHSEAFIGLDTSKLRNAVAIAEAGRAGEVRFLGEIEASGAAAARGIPDHAVWPIAGSTPELRQGKPQTENGYARTRE